MSQHTDHQEGQEPEKEPGITDLATAVRFLKALADQSRLRLLGLLVQQDRSVDELAELLGLRAATVSYHLGILKELDLVSMRAQGNTHLYHFNGKGLGRLNQVFSTPERVAGLALDDGADAWEREVLHRFFEQGRLKEIPVQHKKRLVVLRWLARQFEWGRTYTEAEVNELLKRYHPDSAALRRYLVESRLMGRDRGVYWLLTPPPAPEQ